MRLRRAALAAAVLASAAACQILAGIGDDDFTVAPIADGGAEADAPAPSVDFCAHARPPPRPPPGPSGDGSTRTYVFAMDTFTLAPQTDAGVTVGYDLDGVCTCFDGAATAHDATRSCASPGDATLCDDQGGIDNGFARLYRASSVLGSGPLGASVQREADCGKQAVVLVLRDYNGMANDEEVSLGPLLSAGIRETLDGAPGVVGPSCGEDAATDGPAFAAKRDGTDVWSYPRDTLGSASTDDDPRPIQTLTGYVSNFRLVVAYNDDEHKLPFTFGGKTLRFGTPLLTALLVPLDAESPPRAFAMADGVIGGRVKADELVTALGGAIAGHSLDGGRILTCADPVGFPAVRGVVCASADISSLASNDFAPRGCDALSVMLQFRAGPAHLHGEYTAEEPDTSSCPAGFGTCPP